MAQGILAVRPIAGVHLASHLFSSLSRHDISESWSDIAPRPGIIALDGMGWWRLLPTGTESFHAEQKPYTRKTNSSKWKSFSIWSVQDHLDPVEVPLQKILDYMLHLKHAGLIFSTLKLHLAVMSACYVVMQLFSVFTPNGIQVLKGLLHTYPRIRYLTSAWELNILLLKLVEPPFKLQLIYHLALKTDWLL